MKFRMTIAAASLLLAIPAYSDVDGGTWSQGAGAKPLEIKSMVRVYPNMYCQGKTEQPLQVREANYHILATAAANGDVETLESMFRGCADPNWKPAYVKYPPYFHVNSAMAMLSFFNAGADISFIADDGRNVLFHQMSMHPADPMRFHPHSEVPPSNNPEAKARHESKMSALSSRKLEMRRAQPSRQEVEKIGNLILSNVETGFVISRDRIGYTAIDAVAYGGSESVLAAMLAKLGSQAPAIINDVSPRLTPAFDRALGISCHASPDEAHSVRQSNAEHLLRFGGNPIQKSPLKSSPGISLSFADKFFWIRPGDAKTAELLERVVPSVELEKSKLLGRQLAKGGSSDNFWMLKADPLSYSCLNR